jgi:tetratricopeptide (TPR) repeat protein
VVVALGAAAVGGYYLLRPSPPPLPVPDLSNADPEVAAAVAAALDGVKAEPRSAAAWGKLGMVLRAHDFDVESVQAFQAAERFDPDDPRWPYLQGLTLVLHDPDAGLESLRRAAARARDENPEPRLRLAEVLLDRGLVEEAEATATTVVERRPWDPRAGLVLARAAAQRGDWAAVLRRTESIRDEPASRKRAAVLRADAYRRLDRTAEADAEASRAAQYPADAGEDYPYVRAVLELQVGGDRDYRQGAQLLSAGRAADAVGLLERAAVKSKNPYQARLLLGRALNEAGDPAAARRVLTECTRIDPNSVEGWFQLGNAHFLLGDVTAAADSFGKAIALKPDHALAHYNLGHARKKLGDRKGAEVAFEEALRCRPDHEQSRQALADLRAGK